MNNDSQINNTVVGKDHNFTFEDVLERMNKLIVEEFEAWVKTWPEQEHFDMTSKRPNGQYEYDLAKLRWEGFKYARITPSKHPNHIVDANKMVDDSTKTLERDKI